jgi:hypothetical protein
MSATLRAVRLAAILLPAALVLHELAYLSAGGGLVGAHHYLEILVPVTAALAVSLALAALVLPSLGSSSDGPQVHAPFILALALLGIFVAQESAEALLLGGGVSGLAASAAVAWLAPPLALLLGTLASALIAWLERTGALLATPPARRRRRRSVVEPADPGLPSFATLACTCLAFGFARRPPPHRALHPAS